MKHGSGLKLGHVEVWRGSNCSPRVEESFLGQFVVESMVALEAALEDGVLNGRRNEEAEVSWSRKTVVVDRMRPRWSGPGG